jgi:O-acetylserine/cysteine efflux transporter
MQLRHILMVLIVAAVWGFNFIAVKIGLMEVPPFLYGAGRFVIAALPAFFIKKPNVSWAILIGIGLMTCFKFSFMFMGIYMDVSAGLASLILQIQGFFTLILSVFFYKAKISANHLLGMVISLIGMILIGCQFDTQSTLIGFSLILSAALAWAYSNILFRKAGKVDMFALTVWTSVIPPLPMLIGGFMYEGYESIGGFLDPFSKMTLIGWLCLLYTACISTWVGTTLWGILLKTYEPYKVAPFSLLVPIFGITFASLILGEEFGVVLSIACLFIFVGLIINQWPVEGLSRTEALQEPSPLLETPLPTNASSFPEPEETDQKVA